MQIKYDVEFCDYKDVRRLRPRRVVAANVILPSSPTPRNGKIAPLALVRRDGITDERPLHTDRGHLVALKFGGPENAGNLVPMFGGFNSSAGDWGKFESALETHLGRRGNAVNLDIWISYAHKAHVIPKAFRIVVSHNRGEVLPDHFRHPNILFHNPPIAFHMEVSEFMFGCARLLQRYQDAMEAACWYVELQRRSDGRDPKIRAGCIGPGEVDFTDRRQKDVFYASRPYAVLDFIDLNAPADYKRIGGPHLMAGMNNGNIFTPEQRKFILEMNVVRSLGYMKSDLYGLTQLERFEKTMLSSTDAAAEIDHIWPKQRAGSNTYSNARLVSSWCNQKLKRKTAPQEVADLYRDLGGIPKASTSGT